MSAPTAGPAARDRNDPRVRRTEAALHAAFNRLFIDHGYDAITPAQIATAAGVGRSTFYEHYAGKAALFRDSATAVLRPLADAAAGRDTPALVGVVRHFWDNRRLIRRMIGGRPATILRGHLADLIEAALRADDVVAALPLPLVALGAAATELSLIEAWLSGRHACTADQLAAALAGIGRSLRHRPAG